MQASLYPYTHLWLKGYSLSSTAQQHAHSSLSELMSLLDSHCTPSFSPHLTPFSDLPIKDVCHTPLGNKNWVTAAEAVGCDISKAS